MSEDAAQRGQPLGEVARSLHWLVRTSTQWRWMPHDLPPWSTVYQQTQRRLRAGVFEALLHDLRAVLRLATGRVEAPSAAIFDARTLRSSPESGARAGYDAQAPPRVHGFPSLCVTGSQQYSGAARRCDRHSRPCRRTKRTMSQV
jgi:transposase